VSGTAPSSKRGHLQGESEGRRIIEPGRWACGDERDGGGLRAAMGDRLRLEAAESRIFGRIVEEVVRPWMGPTPRKRIHDHALRPSNHGDGRGAPARMSPDSRVWLGAEGTPDERTDAPRRSFPWGKQRLRWSEATRAFGQAVGSLGPGRIFRRGLVILVSADRRSIAPRGQRVISPRGAGFRRGRRPAFRGSGLVREGPRIEVVAVRYD